MPTLTLAGTGSPFLHVSLQKGERFYAESNAMVMLENNLELQARMKGGFLGALARKFFNEESFFVQEVVATGGSGDALFAPVTPGEMEILDVGETQYRMIDGAFMAHTEGVQISSKAQTLTNALFSNTGGFFVMETSGQGQCVVAGLGVVMAIDVVDEHPVIIDNGHILAWDSRLKYEPGISTNKKGFLSNLVNFSGEGLISKFSGRGKVYLSSRQRGTFMGWIAAGHTHAQSR